jgi:predicted ribonuclease YlaK
LNGSAGTGKTFIAMYLALEEILDKDTPYDKLVIIRSVVPIRDIGFLPGTEEEKQEVYTAPYRGIVSELIEDPNAWDALVNQGAIEFTSTSFIRGITLTNAIIIVDEMQNLNGRELNTIITRIGENCRFIMCGDYFQSDFKVKKERDDILQFLKIMNNLKYFETIEFTWEDIVRSDFVRDYIMTKELMKRDNRLNIDW